MALRLSREQAAIELPDTEEQVLSLPSVRKALGEETASSRGEPEVAAAPEMGDDDEADLEDLGEDDFYADALEDA
ncbi:hypothetical protein [Streptomyces typhae]|uniref:hypothetical protein n=1 Tax=Streptomyces typhae TaxID=2681492 RepID=UPI001FE3508C|nr:hypothetical protein [Streptomyces typhae]